MIQNESCQGKRDFVHLAPNLADKAGDLLHQTLEVHRVGYRFRHAVSCLLFANY